MNVNSHSVLLRFLVLSATHLGSRVYFPRGNHWDLKEIVNFQLNIREKRNTQTGDINSKFCLNEILLLWEFSFYTADVFLEHLSVPYLLLHVPGLLGVATEHEQSGSEPVEAMDGSQVLEVVLLGQNEHHGVVTVAPARMDLKAARI